MHLKAFCSTHKVQKSPLSASAMAWSYVIAGPCTGRIVPETFEFPQVSQARVVLGCAGRRLEAGLSDLSQ
jgi:hypothetical protein